MRYVIKRENVKTKLRWRWDKYAENNVRVSGDSNKNTFDIAKGGCIRDAGGKSKPIEIYYTWTVAPGDNRSLCVYKDGVTVARRPKGV